MNSVVSNEAQLFIDAGFVVGDIVQHFKRELIKDKTSNEYLYKILNIAKHTETGELLVIYAPLYESEFVSFKDVFARPYEMFISDVDREKYPNIKQKRRFEKYTK